MATSVRSEGEQALVSALRMSGLRQSDIVADHIAERGVPTRRNEAWKYSDLRSALPAAEESYPPPDQESDASIEIRESLATGDIIAAIAACWLCVSLHCVESGDSKLIVENLDRDLGDDPFDALASRIDIAPGGTLTRIVKQSGPGVRLSSARVKLGANARFNQFVLAEGAKLARIETYVSVEGEGAEVTLNGVYLAGAGRHADLTSVIEHKAPGGVTRQLIKGVARKGGRGVFQGKIVVERGAQKTDARQHHRGLLLEDGAEIFAKPELMIHADDVQCAHGNTAGGLDESALFYMRSRGLPEAEVRALLIEAFLVETIPEGLPAELYDELIGMIRAWLAGARQ